MNVSKCGLSAMILFFLLLFSPTASADGFYLGKKGVYIPEKEQRAFIEWNAGQERLYVATRTVPSKEPSVWIVPIPALPNLVKAVPSEEFPQVLYFKSAVKPAIYTLKDVRKNAISMDTGLFPLIADAFGIGESNRFSKGVALAGTGHSNDVEVHQHVEKLGMVVEVLTAKTTAGLDRYLNEKQLDVRSGEIIALTPYLQKDFALICSWPANPKESLPARAVRIDFPTADIYYPLMPTRVNDSRVDTGIHVRGWVQPRPGNKLSGFRCRYYVAAVTETSFEDVLNAQEQVREIYSKVGKGKEEPVTHVEIDERPQTWTEDLYLVPGAPAAIRTAEAIRSAPILAYLGIPAGIGVLLAAFLPLAIFSHDRRRPIDWLWSSAAGAAICLSIYATLIVFYFWCRQRKLYDTEVAVDVLGKIRRRAFLGALIVCLISCAGLAIYASVGPESKNWNINYVALQSMALVSAMISALVMVVISYGYQVAREKFGWLLIFAALHGALTWILCQGMENWLRFYDISVVYRA